MRSIWTSCFKLLDRRTLVWNFKDQVGSTLASLPLAVHLSQGTVLIPFYLQLIPDSGIFHTTYHYQLLVVLNGYRATIDHYQLQVFLNGDKTTI